MSVRSDSAALPLTQKSTSDPIKSRRLSRRRLQKGLLSTALFVVVVAAWEATSRYWIDPLWISSPRLVAERLWTGMSDGSLALNTWITVQEALIGLIIGTLAGVIAGLLLARVKPVAELLDPYILGAYSLPRIALAPFFVLWLGIGLASKVVLVVSVVFFVVLFNVRQGIETVDSDLTDAMKSMGASQWEITRQVVIPTVAPWIVSAVKIGVGMALVSAVVGEMVGSTGGLGWYVTRSLNQFDMTGGVTALLVMAAIAMLLYYFLAAFERRLFAWRGDGHSGTAPM
jgi:NitT/TauT family transport system permease protein